MALISICSSISFRFFLSHFYIVFFHFYNLHITLYGHLFISDWR